MCVCVYRDLNSVVNNLPSWHFSVDSLAPLSSPSYKRDGLGGSEDMLHVHVAVSNAPINVKPHLPHPGDMWGLGGD